MPSSTIPPPRVEELLAPLLASLPAAAISPTPPTALLPLLSPILRQRVELLSSPDSSPWLPLLCYDTTKATHLTSLAQTDRLEPHPVSGEVEVDWDLVEITYKRIDAETLQSLLCLHDLGLSVKLIWCVNDEGSNHWRIGEVGTCESTDLTWGYHTINEAETAAKAVSPAPQNPSSYNNRTNGANNNLLTPELVGDQEDDDADYWAQYDNTPAQTPAPKHSPAPPPGPSHQNDGVGGNGNSEDDYYAQYAQVQPAMDNHDPDEAHANGEVESTLGHHHQGGELSTHHHHHAFHNGDNDMQSSSQAWRSDILPPTISNGTTNHSYSDGHNKYSQHEIQHIEDRNRSELAHPRPGSSTSNSSGGSDTVARLERRAAAGESSEVAIKTHIGSSVKSLYRLARVAGIEREEFERLVRTELECLALMDE